MMNATAVDTKTSTDGLFVIAVAPAGWYEIGEGIRRWFDGRQWTDYYAPVLVLVPDTDAPSSSSLRVDHGFHLIMTIMTLSAWLPVWGILSAVHIIRLSVRRPAPARSIRA